MPLKPERGGRGRLSQGELVKSGAGVDPANESSSNPEPPKLLVRCVRFPWGNPTNGSSSNSQWEFAWHARAPPLHQLRMFSRCGRRDRARLACTTEVLRSRKPLAPEWRGTPTKTRALRALRRASSPRMARGIKKRDYRAQCPRLDGERRQVYSATGERYRPAPHERVTTGTSPTYCGEDPFAPRHSLSPRR